MLAWSKVPHSLRQTVHTFVQSTPQPRVSVVGSVLLHLLGQARLAEGPCGTVYVTSAVRLHGNDRVYVFCPNRTFSHEWGVRGHRAGEFIEPHGIAVALVKQKPYTHAVIVVDQGNHRVQVFRPDGRFLRMWGSHGYANGQLDHPQGVGVVQQGPSGETEVVVSEGMRGNRVQVFRLSDGAFLRAWKLPILKHSLEDGIYCGYVFGDVGRHGQPGRAITNNQIMSVRMGLGSSCVIAVVRNYRYVSFWDREGRLLAEWLLPVAACNSLAFVHDEVVMTGFFGHVRRFRWSDGFELQSHTPVFQPAAVTPQHLFIGPQCFSRQ